MVLLKFNMLDEFMYLLGLCVEYRWVVIDKSVGEYKVVLLGKFLLL